MENTDRKNNKMTKLPAWLRWNNHAVHRDLGYFYLGLIISFSLSGIMLNHRIDWHLDKYTVNEKEIFFDLSGKANFLSEEKFAEDLAKELGIKDKFRRLMIRRRQLSISYACHRVNIDIETGKGRMTETRLTPLLGQIAKLHRDNSTAWICYSDSFAISLIIIAITGILLPRGKKSFRKRGWKLACAGIVFPIVILCLVI